MSCGCCWFRPAPERTVDLFTDRVERPDDAGLHDPPGRLMVGDRIAEAKLGQRTGGLWRRTDVLAGITNVRYQSQRLDRLPDPVHRRLGEMGGQECRQSIE